MTAPSYGVDEILIRNARYGYIKAYRLRCARTGIYTLSHQGSTLDSLVDDTDLAVEVLEKNLSCLIARKLLVKLDGFYISLALRPRDELVQNYHDKTTSEGSVLRMQPRLSLPVYSESQLV